MIDTLESLFHGRDIFMPVAAHLACGADFDSIGRDLPADSLNKADIATDYVRVLGECVELRVVHVDKFGNLMLSIRFGQLKQLLNVDMKDKVAIIVDDKKHIAEVTEVFSMLPKGSLALYENSFGFAELAVNQGSAKDLINIDKGSTIRICK